jgi:enamine deaminase RidA (YjgF/YER057c/UK114 family)
MKLKRIASGFLFILLILDVASSRTAALELSQERGDTLQRKIEEITKNGAKNPVAAKKTPMSEPEVNSYLAFNVKDKIPRGLTNPQITMIGDGQLSGRVVVDFDEVKRHRRSQGLTDPLSYISGQVPLTARGVLRARDGKGQFQLASAEILGVPLPKPIVQELVTFFSRTRENPRGFDIDAPFELPARVREIVINRGDAVVIQ